jgi:hypothetical protein
VDLQTETNISEEHTASIFSSKLRIILRINSDYFPKEHLTADLLMTARNIFFEVGTEFLNLVQMYFLLMTVNSTELILMTVPREEELFVMFAFAYMLYNPFRSVLLFILAYSMLNNPSASLIFDYVYT